MPLVHLKASGIYWRMNDLCVSPIELADASPHRLGDGEEMVDSVGGSPIPKPQAVEKWGQQSPSHGVGALMANVAMIIPQKTSGRQTIADVHCLWRRYHPVTESTLVADHQIIPAQIEPLEGQGIQWQKRLVAPLDERESIQPRGTYVPLSILERHCFGPVD
jgi:hypothetical protein